jgi:hypothetical protein
MLTDCDTCKYLSECEKDPQKQLTGCWRYRDFLADLNASIARLQRPLPGQPANGDRLAGQEQTYAGK